MNYYTVKQLAKNGQPTGLWHYTCTTEQGRTYPVGYCANGCAGHDTPDGAREHYRIYQLDTARYDTIVSNTYHKCDLCGELCNTAATAGGWVLVFLCPAHNNREGLDKVLPVPGDAWEGAE